MDTPPLPVLAPPLATPGPGNRVTAQTTTRALPTGAEQTTTIEQRQVQIGHVGFFEEYEGVSSAMRLMSFMSLVASMAFGAMTMVGYGGGLGITITLAFLGAAFGGKIWQRSLEEKSALKE